MKNLLLFNCFILLTSLLIAQPVPQTKKVTAAFYPDLDVEINTPAFNKKKGFTNYEEMMAFLYKLIEKYPGNIDIEFIGESQKGKQIPMVTLHSLKGAEDKVRGWMQGGLHGNEPASSESMFYLMLQMLEKPEMTAMLEEMTLVIVPMANIDGYEKQDRYSANGLDLNRDQTKLAAPETNHLKKAYNAFKPEIAVDFHEYRAYRKDYAKMGDFGVAGYYDAMFLYSGNLNVPENLRIFTEEKFIAAARSVLDENQLSYHDYFSSDDYHGETHLNQGSSNARSSATNNALTNAVSALIEIRGVGLGRTSYKRRVHSSFLIAKSFLGTALANKAELKEQIAAAYASKHEAVVLSARQISDQSIKFIDIGTSSIIELTLPIHNSNKMTSKLQRSRPVAYIIDASQTEVIEKLNTLGIITEKLTSELTTKVEAYTVTNYERDAEKYEGVNRQTVKTSVSEITKTFPERTYMLSLDQRNANLAIEILEPETANSMVSFNVMETKLNSVLPFYRLITPINKDN